MAVFSADLLDELLHAEHERRNLEFKPSCKLDKKNPFIAKIIRAMLAMSNLRDGGYIIVGFEEKDKIVYKNGIDPDNLKTWSFDQLSSIVSEYADPSVSFQYEHVAYNDNLVILIEVIQFEETPIFCKKDFQKGEERPILRKGALYIRPRHKPESCDISTAQDMRDLISITTDKLLRQYVAKAHQAGLTIMPLDTNVDAKNFEEERERI